MTILTPECKCYLENDISIAEVAVVYCPKHGDPGYDPEFWVGDEFDKQYLSRQLGYEQGQSDALKTVFARGLGGDQDDALNNLISIGVLIEHQYNASFVKLGTGYCSCGVENFEIWEDYIDHLRAQ